MKNISRFAWAALAGGLLLSAQAVNWDNAYISGTTPGGRLFFEPNEEIVFTLKLEGVTETLPPDTYFADWECCSDGGPTTKGRAPLPFPADGLVLKTTCAKPGFVCVEANVVTKDGKRVPKNHRWEKRVFFMGGAGVRPDEIPMAPKPADYDAFWKKCLDELAAVPMTAEMKPVPCKDDQVRLYAVTIACAGPQPVTGYLTIPVAASKTNRMPIAANYRGATEDEQLAPEGGPHDRISMLINPNGYELGLGAAYVKKFFREVSQPGYGYGMGPKQNENPDTSYWKYCALRAIRYLQWIKTLPEWDGRELRIGGGSQGDWQCYFGAAFVPGVTHMTGNGSWGCDWTGQNVFGRRWSVYRPNCTYSGMAYFDPVFAAERIACPVDIIFAGLGDYVSPPASLTLVYRNLKGPKKITYVQGSTHGWRPAGTQRVTFENGFGAASDPLDAVRRDLAAGKREIRVAKGVYEVRPKDGGAYLFLKGLSDVTIDFGGSELRGLVNTCFFHLEACTNVTIRNVTLDYATLQFTQGEIVSADADKTWTVKLISGYPVPPDDGADSWPLQVYDRASLELKNPMRCFGDFKIAKVGADTYRISGGIDRRGEVGDYVVWELPKPKGEPEGGHVSACDEVYSRETVRCVFENITEYATPGGRAFEEHLAEGNVYRNCSIVRRPPETDPVKRGLRRLRSGSHDAFMSRRAVVGPKLYGCTAMYHCDDAVNITGMYGVVYEIKGRRVRLLECVPSVFHVGDSAQAMSFEGEALPPMKVTAVTAGLPLGDAERAYLRTIGLWDGLPELCRSAVEIEVDDPSALKRGDAVVSDRAQGNGFEIRGCRFGRNRALGIRLRASHGTVAENVLDRPEGPGLFVGPEYEWLEGGLTQDVLIESNVFVGVKLSIGGAAAHRKPLPRTALKNVIERDNVFTDTEPVPARNGSGTRTTE